MKLTRDETIFFAGSSSQLQRQAADRAAWELRQELNRPLPKIVDPPVQVRVLEAIRAGSPVREVQAGEVIELPKTLAAALAAIGRVQMV